MPTEERLFDYLEGFELWVVGIGSYRATIWVTIATYFFADTSPYFECSLDRENERRYFDNMAHLQSAYCLSIPSIIGTQTVKA